MMDIDQTKIRQLDGTLLLVLQGLIRHRRTTAVAEQLGLSQSAISHALSRLRRLFGDPLFVRRPHGLEPTRQALELAPQIDAILTASRAALGMTSTFEASSSRRGFRLGAPDFLMTQLAPMLLRGFRRTAPFARFAFSQSLGASALRGLRLDEFDVALGRFAAPEPGVAFISLFQDDDVLVMREGHPAASSPTTAESFQAQDHVAVSIGGDFRTFTEQDFADRGLTRRIVAAAPRFTIAFAMVADGECVCVAPRRLARAYAAAFGLIVADLPFALPTIEVMAARRATVDPGVDWLLARIAEAASADPDRPDRLSPPGP